MSAEDLDAAFNLLAEKARQWKGSPCSNDEKLEAYGLFKQGTVGDNTTKKPSMFDFTGGYKWSAWDKRKGMGQEDAKKAYIATVVGQFKAHGYPDEIEDSITQFLPAEAAAGGGEAAPAAAAQ